MTNLIHWMVPHSPLTITEHHHHGRFDLFPTSAARSRLEPELPSFITIWITVWKTARPIRFSS